MDTGPALSFLPFPYIVSLFEEDENQTVVS